MPPLWHGFLPEDEPVVIPEHLRGKRILITGAGGSLGSLLARALAPVCELTLLDQAEHGLYRLGDLPATRLVGSVTNPAFLRNTFAANRTETVFHAAAHKHVPLMEANPLAAAETNILGTEACLTAARESERFVLVSTDKAAAPVSAMGAAKQVAERLTLAAGRTVVRLPNILGSSGSVAPLFTKQIWSKRPVTVTHPEATRFFVSARRAVQALLNAREPGLYVPETTPARRIAELAEHMIARSGRSGVAIAYTALRPGDRLHETLTGPGETLLPSEAGLQRVLTATEPADLDSIRRAVAAWDEPALRRALLP